MDKEINVLLVDDNIDFLETMGYWLKSRGYSVTIATNGVDALKILRHETLDIAFIDVVMPEMSGIVTVQMVRDFNKTLPIIMMSAHGKGDEVKEKGKFYGIFDFFDKGEDFTKAVDLLKLALN